MQGMHLNEIFENNLQIFTPEDSVGEKLKKKQDWKGFQSQRMR